MLLKIVHQTEINYSDLISESVMELRMQPRQEQDQHRLSFSLSIGPPTSVSSYFDWLGNTVHAFSISAFHEQVRIVATSVLETDRPRAAIDQFNDTWPVSPAELDYALYDYLTFGGPVVPCASLTELAALLSPTPGMSMGELALRMIHLIGERFQYEKGVTTAASPITEILDHKKGVCQDFAHLMIGLARELKIPARYVSGLVHPDKERFRGYTQTHAWCELFFPMAGWVGFDPTNSCIVGSNFVKVAIGRDFRDVPPNRGVYRGKATDHIDVTVHTEEIPIIPPELVAERFYPLSIPVYLDKATGLRELAARQQEVQQQQAQQ